MNTLEKIRLLREKMKEEEVDGYLIPSADPHMTEYLPEHYKARSWFSGFDGSAGTLAVTLEKAALWTDGRYFVQAANQLKDSTIELMRTGEPGVKSIEGWLKEELPEKGTMGICGMITSAAQVDRMDKLFQEKEIGRKDVDLISPIWGVERPKLPTTTVWILEEKYAGISPSGKIKSLRDMLKKEDADSMLISRLDSVAWLLNLRAGDVKNTPFALGFCMVLPKETILFIEECRVPEEVRTYLAEQGVKIAPYQSVTQAIAEVMEKATILYEAEGTSEALLEAMKINSSIKLKSGENCVNNLKCIKNEEEIRNTKMAHIKDGIAMVRFAWKLEEVMGKGEELTESDVSEMVLQFRSEQELFLEESFETIAAYGANAAMMHYHPSKEHSQVLKREGFLLVDSGGQYMDGTTDITRTYALGEVTEEEKSYYTMVLKSHIRLAKVIFKEKTSGSNLDILAREVFWKNGLDYRCGTGHGVGFVGVIHEGPQGVGGKNLTPLVPGMILTDEPGIYEEGKIGIRIENELLCKSDIETEYGKFCSFEPITYCPIDTKAIDVQKLENEEVQWLNQYHQMVVEELSPYLTREEQSRLEEKCKPIVKYECI